LKIKAKKTFVSGTYSADAGEVVDVPARKASKLIALGLAVGIKTKAPKKPAASETPDAAQPDPDGPATDASDKTPAPGKKPAQAAQKASNAKKKASGKNGKNSEG
jgi:hypothetical protein